MTYTLMTCNHCTSCRNIKNLLIQKDLRFEVMTTGHNEEDGPALQDSKGRTYYGESAIRRFLAESLFSHTDDELLVATGKPDIQSPPGSFSEALRVGGHDPHPLRDSLRKSVERDMSPD